MTRQTKAKLTPPYKPRKKSSRVFVMNRLLNLIQQFFEPEVKFDALPGFLMGIIISNMTSFFSSIKKQTKEKKKS